jgi:protein subunit release factor A
MTDNKELKIILKVVLERLENLEKATTNLQKDLTIIKKKLNKIEEQLKENYLPKDGEEKEDNRV